MNLSLNARQAAGRVVRQVEWCRLADALATARQGRPAIVEIVGEPGTGKTWLLSNLAEMASRQRYPVLAAGYPAFGSPPMRPFEALAFPGGTATASRSDQSPSAIRCALEGRLAAGGILSLDDVQWADPDSIAFLTDLLSYPLAVPYLLVVAHRSRQTSVTVRDALSRAVTRGGAERLVLEALSPEQAGQLFGLSSRDRRLAALHQAANGNPLYLQALARTGLGTQSETSSTPDQVDQFEFLDITNPFVAQILAEMVHLTSTESAVLAAAAVLGRPATLAELARVSGANRDTTCRALGQLLRRDLLRRQSDNRLFGFRHPLVQRAAYWRIDSCPHSRLHRQVLQLLDDTGAAASERAVHLERTMSGLTDDDREVLMAAALAARQPRLAVRWLEAALHSHGADSDDAAQGLTIRLRYARALATAGRASEGRRVLDEALNMDSLDAAARLDAVMLRALIDCRQGRYAQAHAVVGTELSEHRHASARLAVSLRVAKVGMELFCGGLPSEQRLAGAVAQARSAHNRRAELGALALTGLTRLFHGQTATAVPAVIAANRLVDSLSADDLAARPEILALLGWAELLLHRLRDAEHHLIRGVHAARRTGNRQALAVLFCGLSGVHHEAGRPQEALAMAVAATEAVRTASVRHVHRLALSMRARALAWTEDAGCDEALEIAERAATDGRVHALHWDRIAAICLAQALWIRREHHRSLRTLIASCGGSTLPDAPSCLRAMCFELLSTCGLRLGRHADAADWARRAAVAASVPAEHAYTASAQGTLLMSDDPQAAMALYRRSAELFALAGMRDARARILVSAARAAVADGDTEGAADLVAMAKSSAANPWVTRLEKDLSALPTTPTAPGSARPLAPQTPARRASAAMATLTRREKEIAEIVAMGKRNREIAEELGLSPRTVDVHLTRIYRKLNVSSRTALGRLVTVAEPALETAYAIPAPRG